MFILKEQDRKDLTWAMKTHLLEQCVQLGGCSRDKINFIKEDATYEQLLNLCFNSKPDEVYFEAEALEHCVLAGLMKFEGFMDIKNGQIVFNESLLVETDAAKKENFVKRGAKAVGGAISGSAKYVGGKVAGGAKYTGTKIMGAANTEELKTLSKKVREYFASAQGKSLRNRGGIVLGTAAAIAVFLTWMYKKKFSEAAKACSGRKGPDFKSCVKDAKKKAVEFALSEIKRRRSECSTAANKDKCEKKLDGLVKKWEKKVAKA